MFCILGIQNLIRAMKDSVIITMVGTETVSFLKFWGVMPVAFFTKSNFLVTASLLPRPPIPLVGLDQAKQAIRNCLFGNPSREN